MEAKEILEELKKGEKNISFLIKEKGTKNGFLRNEFTGNINNIFSYIKNQYNNQMIYGIYGDVLYTLEKELGLDFSNHQIDNRQTEDEIILKIIELIVQKYDLIKDLDVEKLK